jgi:uncharacterized protein YbjT (DUF2867 family)
MGTFDVVTGAFGYTGKYIARRLLNSGRKVKTLTAHAHRPDPFAGQVPALPFNFDSPNALAKNLTGVDTLYNTYWVRFNYRQTTYAAAIENSKTLFRAAETAGVRRIVHVSITNPSRRSQLPYFRGKAELEAFLDTLRVNYAIVRPTVIFGDEDILINNIAWLIRRFPFFLIGGNGEYRLQPIFVEDLSELAVKAGLENQNVILDAVGPEIFSFHQLVELISKVLRRETHILHAPASVVLLLARVLGLLVGDVLLTREEMAGLAADLLVSADPPLGHTRLSAWLEESASRLGVHHASELERHYQ